MVLFFCQVPLGIQLLNEMKMDEMCKILEGLHHYVPSICTDESTTLPNGEELSFKEVRMWDTLFGGNQLTVAHARGSIAIRANHPDAKERLEGLGTNCRGLALEDDFMKVFCT